MRLSLLSILASCSVVPHDGESTDLKSEIARLDGEIASLRSEVARLQAVPEPTKPAEIDSRCVPPDLEARLRSSEGTVGRALLHRRADGAYDGYRLSAIQAGSVLDQIGIRNGDILQRIDGAPLDSLASATALHERYFGGDAPEHVTLDLLRKGQPYRLELQFGSCSM